MKNKINLVLVAALCFVFVASCGLFSQLERSSKKSDSGSSSTNSGGTTLEEKAIDATLGGEKIGIPECDDLFERINQMSQSKDDNYVTRAARDFFLSKIRESIKESIEKEKGDKVKVAKNCKEFQDDLDKYKGIEDEAK